VCRVRRAVVHTRQVASLIGDVRLVGAGPALFVPLGLGDEVRDLRLEAAAPARAQSPSDVGRTPRGKALPGPASLQLSWSREKVGKPPAAMSGPGGQSTEER